MLHVCIRFNFQCAKLSPIFLLDALCSRSISYCRIECKMAANSINCCVGKFVKAKIALLRFESMFSVGNNCIALGSTVIDRTGICHSSKFFI